MIVRSLSRTVLRTAGRRHPGGCYTHHQQHQQHQQHQLQYRGMAIYAVGEGWTGSMTRPYVMETIPGHFDEESSISPLYPVDNERQDEESASSSSSSLVSTSMALPVLVYSHDDVVQVEAGWGASALLDTQGQVHLVGRPHDLMNLLRLNRLPERVRKWANQHLDPSDTTLVGGLISKLIGFASGSEDQDTWTIAKEYSLLHDWTRVDLKGVGDARLSQISCSAGFLAVIGSSGTLYTMGVNNRGQCGTGTISNNVWAPQRVLGISSSTNPVSNDPSDEQEEPVMQVALGFQQGYALSKFGRVFSWGKAGRGQLARDVDSDQDGTARQIVFDGGGVVQIASGMHHAALLSERNQVYIWGKNMGRSQDTEEGRNNDRSSFIKPKDAPLPEIVVGLPSDLKVLQIACGSHHTAMLMEDGSVFAVGIASDEAVPLLDPVQLLAPGIIELPVRQFAAHHDRTTVIDKDGQQVIQMHLWKENSLRDYATFTPGYVDLLLDEGQSIESIHRGWLHTLIVTKPVHAQQ